MIPEPTIDMGYLLPASATKCRITGDTQFMFQFYKPCIHFYAPSEHTATYMSKDMLYQSLVVALHGCPLLFGRIKANGRDKSVWIEYDPGDCNLPTLEFQHLDTTTYEYFKQEGFSYSAARDKGLAMPIPNGTISAASEGLKQRRKQPMLMVKVSYLADGGVAIFNMSNHVAFDGNAVFSFLAHWAECNRRIGSGELQADAMCKLAIPRELQTYATSLVDTAADTDDNDSRGDSPMDHNSIWEEEGPAEISVSATKTPEEIKALINKRVPDGERIRSCVFSLPLAKLSALSQQVRNSGMVGPNERVSTNSVLTAFVCQCIARASTEAQTYAAGDWTVFQTMDMRRALGLPPGGLGSPVILAECQATYAEMAATPASNPLHFALVAKRIRQSINKYSRDYLQHGMRWMNRAYARLARDGVDAPWQRFWFTALNTNRRAVGLSCMDRIPVYGADFGAGRPAMARSINPRPNYVISFPGPPTSSAAGNNNGSSSSGGCDYSELHLYVSLESRAMEALMADKSWSALCALICSES
ncbi:hypothetical protein H4217_004565 [Coemansia sp. RSA 1939]|nr:hypothetical protein H4217_004565 [Coemansia sp. RSA 1939]KAJ2609564.1 hypothetical protein EV177_004409 [Coemansia sp. RSA 1804]KAJ2693525.1 hypothetical protein GGH99_001113 [Coemansia sp. RSA 1285]